MTEKRPYRRRNRKNLLIPIVFVLVLAVILALMVRCTASIIRRNREVSETVAETWIEVPDGNGGTFLVKQAKLLERSMFQETDFYENGDYIYYQGSTYTAQQGVDVSYYQGEIDWQQVRAAGISFAMIRAGYRGYEDGRIHADENFQKNVEGALAAGLEVGIYFYSQAITPEEAREEADLVLQLAAGYPITFPIAFDWEHVEESARTDDISSETLTDCCLAFCDTIQAAGYRTSVYFYRSLGYHEYDMDRLKDLEFWFSGFGTYPDYYYEISMWQYSHTAVVPGIPISTDMNLYFVKQPQ